MSLKTLLPLPRKYFLRAVLLAAWVASPLGALGEVSVNHLFDDHMVLQRDADIPVFGKADPGETVRVELAGNTAETIADEAGNWLAKLPPMAAGGPYRLRIAGENELLFDGVLIGEVWIASGQSNMQWTVDRSLNADLVKLTVARNAEIRTIRIRNMGSQEPQHEITGEWTVATPDSVGAFSAVAYAFAEALHAALDVPVGIIDNAWGASSAEAWVPRDVIAGDPELVSIHEEWLEIEDGYDLEAEIAAWEEMEPPRPRKPRERMYTQWRPANLWNGRVLPVVPYAVRGAIWYQGESNAGKALQYRTLFPTLIREWRKAWDRDFPFYFVQLADFREEKAFGPDEKWPVLREAQTHTLHTVPNTGQAVIIDIGEGKDIHPRHKEEVGRRLARWALNRDYGFTDLVCRSPEFDSFEQDGNQLVVKFNYTGSGLRAFDTNAVRGFVVQTEDGEWIPVEGKVLEKDSVELALPDASTVTAVRYAWADNPVCNLFSYEGLPATPFRSDFPKNE